MSSTVPPANQVPYSPTGSSLWFKKVIAGVPLRKLSCWLLVGCLWYAVGTSPVQAASPTPQPSPKASALPAKKVPAAPSPTSTSAEETITPTLGQTTNQLKERLKKILGGSTTTTLEVISEKGGYLGEIIKVNDDALTVKTTTETQIIPIVKDTKFMKRGKPIALSEVVVGNWLAVLGNREKNGGINPELLYVYTTSLLPKDHIVGIGAVNKIDKGSVSIIPRGKDEAIKLALVKRSNLTDAMGEPMEFAKLPVDMNVFFVAFADDKGGWELASARSLVAKAEVRNVPSPTPTPKLKAGSSATPSATKKPVTPKPSPTVAP